MGEEEKSLFGVDFSFQPACVNNYEEFRANSKLNSHRPWQMMVFVFRRNLIQSLFVGMIFLSVERKVVGRNRGEEFGLQTGKSNTNSISDMG